MKIPARYKNPISYEKPYTRQRNVRVYCMKFVKKLLYEKSCLNRIETTGRSSVIYVFEMQNVMSNLV